MNRAEVGIDQYVNLKHTYIKLPKSLFSVQAPSKVPEPRLVLFNRHLADSLGLDKAFLQSQEGIQFLAGNKAPREAIAQAYAGHQFGYFTMLGDGRAILLGEYQAKDKEVYDIQLKGAGRTPYSRGGDGKAALGPMLREYIISEGMHALGIPTTRSLAVITTGEKVIREEALEGARLTRIAKSHIRVGTFQYVARWGTVKELKALADYTLTRHFKEGMNEENPYFYLLKRVIERQAILIAKWQLVGFVHGVMNTDNMAISGETIDYGPCAFMDSYDLKTVFSSIDEYGRYAYENQPPIAAWNLARFAETLVPILHADREEAIRLAEIALSDFRQLYSKNWYEGMRAKLGLVHKKEEDKNLIQELLKLMEKYKADYTNTFLNLTINNREGMDWFKNEDFKKWYTMWQKRLDEQRECKEVIKRLMEANNPMVIPRNHRVEEALEAAAEQKDYSVIKALLEAITAPYDYTKYNAYYTTLPEKTENKYKTYCGT
ncbi:hypothetical protein CS063_06160 [Sporanaerobium hydrogeniformans]|uniref:Uncharacterized protein n=1 Tax=Sporanaerobium hydrogeniformans TaxID=3072179 RepID=A0AC61DFA5_9FIRM|nr:YdiU family protein [Sporanaerobium hydrogeniformans]PHV71272.1 hypothetical protein CS063_06160 [Sporanaerobium hydrogeniformans]